MELIGQFTDGRVLVAMTPEEWAGQFTHEPKPDKLLGVRLRFWRASQKFSLREVADRCKVSASTLSRIENGKHQDIAVSTLARVQAILPTAGGESGG